MLEYHLDLWTWLNSVQMRTPTGSRWVSNNYITRCYRWLGSVGVRVAVPVGERCRSENQLQTEGLGPQDTQLSSPAEWGRRAAMVRGTWGKYVAVCLRLQLTSHTQETSTLLNKVWEVYFYKEACSFVNWSCHYVSAYICMYMSIQQK